MIRRADSWGIPLYIQDDIMDLKIRDIHPPHAGQARRPAGFWITGGTIENSVRRIGFFPLLGLIVAAIPVDMGAELEGIIQGVVACSQTDDMRRGRGSHRTGLIARPVDVGGIAPGAAARAASTAAGFDIPDATFTARILRPQPA